MQGERMLSHPCFMLQAGYLHEMYGWDESGGIVHAVRGARMYMWHMWLGEERK